MSLGPRSLRSILSAALCATVLALAACGGGGGGSSEPTDPGVAGEPYFPYTVGAAWRYSEGSGRVTAMITSTQLVNGDQAYVLSTAEAASTDVSYFVKSSAGVRQVPGPTADAFERAIGSFDRVRFPLRAGSKFTAVDKSLGALDDFDGDGRLDNATIKIEVTVVGFESVFTPVQTFNNALLLRTVITYSVTLSSSGRLSTTTSTSDEWHAADVGPVRATQLLVATGGFNERSDQLLVSYKVGNRRGNAGEPGPTVTSLTPTGDSTVAKTTTVTLSFSTDIDPTSVTASSLTVRGPDGLAVAGQQRWIDARQLQFTPAAALANGEHTATLAAGAADQFGAGVPTATSWTFSVDAAPATVETRTPTAGSQGATAQIAATFNEAMSQALTPTISVVGPGGTAVPGTAFWQGERTLAFSANERLASGSYTVSVPPGIADQFGNVTAAPTQWSFDIDANGPTPVSVSPANNATDVAIGTAVRVTFDEPVDPASLTAGNVTLWSKGQMVSALVRAEANAIVLTPSTPLLRGVFYQLQVNPGVTDTLGNGLAAPVTASFTTDSGRYALPEPLAVFGSAISTGHQLVDLSGDGMPDLLATQSTFPLLDSRIIRVLRNADGTLTNTATEIPFLGCYLNGSPTVGEFSGDGRVDVAVPTSCGAGIEWIAQTAAGDFVPKGRFASDLTNSLAAIRLAGGSRSAVAAITADSIKLWRPVTSGEGFAAPEVLYTGASRLGGISVVDFNGDGRLDIVAQGLLPLNQGLIFALQRADGGFDIRVEQIPTMSGPYVLADFNGDGRPDLVYAESGSGTFVSIRQQASDGSFGNPERVATRLQPMTFRALDFNGDGRMDLVVSHFQAVSPGSTTGNSTGFSVVLQTSAGTLGASFNPFEFDDPTVIPFGSGFSVADFTGDGRLDFLVGNLLIRQKAGAVFPSMGNTRERPVRRQGLLRALDNPINR